MNVDLDALVAECRTARSLPEPETSIARLIGGAIAQAAALAAAVDARNQSRPNSASMAQILLNEEYLTIYQLSFPPYVWGAPHDHATWAIIGVYAGAEAFNVYDESRGSLTCVDRRVISAGEVVVLPPDLIHDIENPTEVTSGSIHVYGNRHFDHPGRRIWRHPRESAERFSPDKSLEYGLALTRKRREAVLRDNRRADQERVRNLWASEEQRRLRSHD